MEWKIVAYSNYDLDTVSDRLVANSVAVKAEAEVMCKALCDCVREGDKYHYKVEDENYVLYEWKP